MLYKAAKNPVGCGKKANTKDTAPGVPVLTTPATTAGCPICPDFLRRLVALMRLSLMKGAHAGLSSTAWQEIEVKPSVGLSGIMALDLPLPCP